MLNSNIIFLHVLFSSLQHIMQLLDRGLSIIHSELHNERLIRWWKRFQNDVNLKVVINIHLQFVHPFNELLHLYNMHTH